ncbi:MAG TPA: transporter [Pyrinomonadaceae bacterium]|nr:transporter [Pyrinomonadaceae bacterium]
MSSGIKLPLVLLVLLSCCPSVVTAQQPFVTDDSDTTPKRKFHFEFSNEFDWLESSAFPAVRQNTADFEIAYGLLEDVEISVAAPVLTIFAARSTAPGRVSGLGDMSTSVKYNFLKEKEKSRRPALAVSVSLELPTGDIERQLGSGLIDVYINGIVQRSVTEKTKLRLNSGVLFSGNTTTGAIGIRSRGTVFTSSGSLVRQIAPKLQLGGELAGAFARNTLLGKGQLQAMFGGNYQVRPNASFDFGVVAGKYVGSPRFGIQVGISIDF